MPYPDDEILHLRKRVAALEKQIREVTRFEFCEDCKAKVPPGFGIGFSVPEEEWTDRTKSRPMKTIPLCIKCTVVRMLKK